MKSKLSFRKTHSLQASSTSNWRFGGTSRGCVGERSVPMTWAEGNWSAKSLSDCVSRYDGSVTAAKKIRGATNIAQMPVVKVSGMIYIGRQRRGRVQERR